MLEQTSDNPYLTRALILQTQADQTKAAIEINKQQTWELEKQAIKIEKDLELTKFRALQSILIARGLGVCSAYSWRTHTGEKPESLGIFPLLELRHQYQTYFLSSNSCDYASNGSQVTQIEILCPQHFPRIANVLEGSSMCSEVIEESGSYYTLVNHIDVSDISVHKYYPKEVYRFFGLEPSKGMFFYTTLKEPNVPTQII